MLDRSESNICGLLLKHWTIPSDAAKDREAIESTSRDEAGAYRAGLATENSSMRHINFTFHKDVITINLN